MSFQLIHFDLENGSATGQTLKGQGLTLSPDGDRLLHHSLWGDRVHRNRVWISTIEPDGLDTRKLNTKGLEEIDTPHGLGWASPRHLYVYGRDGVHLLDLEDPELRWTRIRGRLPKLYRWHTPS
jgi:hypothetical protein